MSSNVDAVIAALKVALAEAERSTQLYWKVREANRWIGQLPGAWFGRWRNLMLNQGPYGDGEAARLDFIIQLRATLAYLEAHRDEIARSSWFSRGKVSPSAVVVPEPVDAEYEDVPQKLHTLPVPRSRTRTTK